MLPKLIFSSSILSAIAAVILINITSPSEVGPAGILVFFALVYIVFVGAIAFMLYLVNTLIIMVRYREKAEQNLHKMSFKKAYYFSTVLAFAPIILIAQQSVGRIGFFEIILVSVFEIMACIYVSKR